MKKTLNAFIKQSAQSKKGPTFIDVNPQVRSNPYEPEMSIREAVEVSTTDYEYSHGKPRGSAGGWMFGKHRSVNFDKHKEGEDYVTIKGVHTYGEAKKKAKTWAAEKGHTLIHVLPESVELQEKADDDIREQKIMHGGKHVATIRTFRGRAGGLLSSVHTPSGEDASKKYGITIGDTKKEMLRMIKQHHKKIQEGRISSAIDAVRRPIAVGTVGGSAGTAAVSDPNASTNRRIANTIDGAASGNSGEVVAGSRAASARALQIAQRGAGVVVPSMRVRANAGAARESQRVATRAAEIAASRAAGRATLRTGLRAVGAVASKAAWPLALGMAGYDAVKGYTAQPNAPVSRKLRNAAQNAASGLTFGILPAPQGVNEAAELILRGIKAVAPIVKRATAALERRVAAKAAASDGSNVIKFVPKTAPPKVSISTPSNATVLNMPKTTIGRAIVKAKAARPAAAPTSSKPGTMSNLTGKVGSTLRGDTARTFGATIATQSAVDAVTPNFQTPPGQDPSYAPKGMDSIGAIIGGTAAATAGANKAAWKRGAKWGLPIAAAVQGVNLWRAKNAQSTPEYKANDAAIRSQQPQK